MGFGCFGVFWCCGLSMFGWDLCVFTWVWGGFWVVFGFCGVSAGFDEVWVFVG